MLTLKATKKLRLSQSSQARNSLISSVQTNPRMSAGTRTATHHSSTFSIKADAKNLEEPASSCYNTNMDHFSSCKTTIGGSSLKRRRQSSPSAEGPRELGQMRTRRDASSGSTNFVGSGSGVYFVRMVRRAFASNNEKQTLTDTNADDLVPGEDDRLESPSTLWRRDELSFPDNESAAANSQCTFDELVAWSKPYFDSWHPLFPFLHAPTILGILEKVSISGFTSLEPVESVIVRSIMSISMADRRQLPKEEPCLVPIQLVFHTAEDAILALQSLMVQASSLPNLQAVVSVQIFLISMLRLNAASRIGGFIVRMAFHLGLHRCPTRFEQFSAAEVDIRRRLFWSIYSIERYLSQSLGLPLDLKDDDLDVCDFDNELHQPLATVMNSSPRVSTPNGSYLLLPAFLAKHGRIKGLILELRNKSVLHSHSDPDELARIDAEISRWWNAAQDLVDPVDLDIDSNNQFRRENRPNVVPLKSSHRLLLMVQKHESVILLNRPVITSGYNTSAFAVAMQKCIGASKAIITKIYRHISSAIEAEDAISGRIMNPLVWPGFVWMVWQSGLILLYAASEGYYSDDVAQREASMCVVILENLSLRGTIWPSSCAAVIRELQLALSTNKTGVYSQTGREDFQARSLEPCNMSKSQGQSNTRAPHVPTSANKFSSVDQVGSVPKSTESSGSYMHSLLLKNDARPTTGEVNLPTDRTHYATTPPTHMSPLEPALNCTRHKLWAADSTLTAPFLGQPGNNSGYFNNRFSSSDFDGWANMNGGSEALDCGDESYDIFQLLDPSYL